MRKIKRSLFPPLSLRLKLIMTALLSTSMMLGVGMFTWKSMSQSVSNSEWVLKEVVPAVTVSRSIMKELESFEKFYYLAFLVKNQPERFDESLSGADRAFDRLIGSFELLKELKSSASEELKSKLLKDWDQFRAEVNPYRDALAEAKFDVAEKGRVSLIEPRVAAINDLLSNIELANINLIEKERENMAAVAAATVLTKNILVFGLSLAGLLTLVFSTFFAITIGRQIDRVTQELIAQVDESQKGAKDFANSAHSLRQNVQSSGQALTQVSSSLDQLKNTIHTNTAAAEDSAKASTKSIESLNQGMTAFNLINELIQAIQEGNASVNETFKGVHHELDKIVALTDAIGSKTNVINDIMFQTKLLSFNASVEAARAGEHGKGFTVVAQEIGTLANNSGSAAKDISDLLDSSRANISEIITSTETKMSRVLGEVEDRVRKAMTAVIDGLQIMSLLVTDSREVGDKVAEIRKSSQEQLISLSEISNAVGRLSVDSVGTDRESQKVDELAVSIQDQAQNISESVTALESVISGKKHERVDAA